MRKSMLACFAAAVTPAAASAQQPGTTQAMAVNASVPRACTVGGATLAPAANVNFSGLNGSALQIDSLVDPQTLSTKAASAEVRFEAVCNLPHRIRIETQNNGLWQSQERGRPRPAGFANAIPYRATLGWRSDLLTLNADGQIRRIAESDLFVSESRLGDLTLRLEIDAGATNAQANSPIVAGTYGDTLRITLEPQQ
jgi:hypothetical protein